MKRDSIFNYKVETRHALSLLRNFGSSRGESMYSMVVQIRLWLLVKQRKNVQKLPACKGRRCDGSMPEGWGGFYKFASSEFLHKPACLWFCSGSRLSDYRKIPQAGGLRYYGQLMVNTTFTLTHWRTLTFTDSHGKHWQHRQSHWLIFSNKF